ncbi:hypothetical protein EVAR_94712_1 [Eumeta japonica]|uniref:Uncharacterized protein n=1 Tax=Eumeta variegata TaxID=151549 RepID=A0A4C1UX17_EUMVA|nr:hypothetical protein EVAR_94712_1 [Eumeta japonica]
MNTSQLLTASRGAAAARPPAGAGRAPSGDTSGESAWRREIQFLPSMIETETGIARPQRDDDIQSSQVHTNITPRVNCPRLFTPVNIEPTLPSHDRARFGESGLVPCNWLQLGEGCGWESLMKSVTLGNVTMSHRTRGPPNALRLSPTQL